MGRSHDILAPYIIGMMHRKDDFSAVKNPHCDFGENLTLSGGARYVGNQFAAEDNIYPIESALTFDLGLTYRQGPALLRFNL